MGKPMTIDGLPVKDATKSVLLHITSSDVKVGRSKDPDKCAAAVACRRDLGAREARVWRGRTYLKFNGHWQRYQTSKALRTEIVAFDRGGKFEPGEYALLKMTKLKPSKNKKRGKGNGKKNFFHTTANVRQMDYRTS